MRARNIKPGFWKNEKLGRLDYHERLLFIGLWGLADWQGRLEDRPEQIRVELFPYDDARTFSVDNALDSLAPEFITRYEVQGVKCIQINTFLRHNPPKIEDKKRPSRYPPAPPTSGNFRKTSETSEDFRKTLETSGSNENRPESEKSGNFRKTLETSEDFPLNSEFLKSESLPRGGASSPGIEDPEVGSEMLRLVAKVRACHESCRSLGELAIVATLRIFAGSEADLDEAIEAFGRQWDGSWPQAPLKELEKYLRRAARVADGIEPGGRGGAAEEPELRTSREVFVPKGLMTQKNEKNTPGAGLASLPVAGAAGVTGCDRKGVAT